MRKILLPAFALISVIASAQAYHDNSSNFEGLFLIITIAIAIAIFILCRELICWYYKINKSISNQEEIIKLLKDINEKLKKE